MIDVQEWVFTWIVLDLCSFFAYTELMRALKVYGSACIVHDKYCYVSGHRLGGFGLKNILQKMFMNGCVLPRDMHTYTHVFTHNTHMHAYAHIHACIHTHASMYTYIHTYTLTYSHAYTDMHACIHAHACTHTQ